MISDISFEGQLNTDNRWVKLSRLLTWKEIEKKYVKNFRSIKRALAKSERMVLGSLIIKDVLQLSDEDSVASISEFPAKQFFFGLEGFVQRALFDASLLVYFLKRFLLPN